MASYDQILKNATALAAARIGVLGAQPLSKEMMALCVLEAMQMDNIRQKLSIGSANEGVLDKRLAEIEPKVTSEALATRLDQSLNAEADRKNPGPRF